LADSDSFIEEVTDEVRRDRMFRLWRRFGPAVIGALVAVVAATAVIEWRKHADSEAAKEAGGALIEAQRAAEPAARAARLADLAPSLDGGAGLAARLAAAAARAEAGDAAPAAAAYAEVAEAAGADDPLGAFAAFRAATLAAATAAPGDAVAALTPLAEGDGAFRLLALEARAAARLRAGDRAGARADLEAAAGDPAATEALRARSRETLAAMGDGA
jgi:hypothetical protein